MAIYPPDAYSPSGQLWWDLCTWPDKCYQKFGTEPRLAAWLKFNAVVGDIFTLRKLREALGSTAAPNDHEHFNRRFRQLRKYGWSVLSSRDVAGLKPDEYRLDAVGSPIWLGKSQYAKKATSAKIRREVFDRDGHRCVLCGVGAGESYPGQTTKRARLTLGHFVADSLQGSNDIANLRTECAVCNEPARDEARRCESAAEIWPRVRNLGRADKARLLSWIQSGKRGRDAVDRLFDIYRLLPPPKREEIRNKLMLAVKD